MLVRAGHGQMVSAAFHNLAGVVHQATSLVDEAFDCSMRRAIQNADSVHDVADLLTQFTFARWVPTTSMSTQI
jgi:hypothetical protein